MYQEQKIKDLIQDLWNESDRDKSLDIAINLANELLLTLGAPQTSIRSIEDALDKAYPFSYFKNQKMETWFEKHRFYNDARTALKLFDDDNLVYESSFYWMNESSTKGRIAATTLLGSNWEDSELTMRPEYKLGIDFYLNHDSNSLLMVISKKGNVRVLEFSERLSHTQKEILESLINVFNMPGLDLSDPYEPQRSIHEKLWTTLQLNEVNKKFYSGISELFEELSSYLTKSYPKKDNKDLQLFSSRLLGRLLFIWFLRKKLIIDETYGYFDYMSLSSTQYYEQKLKILFFDTLNNPVIDRNHEDKSTPFLNGGLFEAHDNDFCDEYIQFPKDYFNRLYDHLHSFNFTVDESSPEYEQIAIDPEMLGRVFENLLASIVPETSSTANERKNKGAFYTPREIVSYMCKEALKEHIKTKLNDTTLNKGIDQLIDMNDAKFIELKSTGGSKLWGVRSLDIQKHIIEILNKTRIFDPACGSGAFPMGMLQLFSQTYDRLVAKYDAIEKKHVYASGKTTYNKYESKLSIIKNNLYGSDIEPMAIEISRLRSWLSLIIEEHKEIHPLPNLDFNFVCCNTLMKLNSEYSLDFGGNEIFEQSFNQLRDLYFSAHTKKDKELLKDDFEKLFSSYIGNDFTSTRVRQLMTWNPFDITKPANFFDSNIMFNVDEFDIVIANPPYVGSGLRGLNKMKKEMDSYYRKEYPNSAEYKINLYPLFMELGYNLVTHAGIVNYILPDSYLVGMYFSKIRHLLTTKARILSINILNDKVFNATVGFSTIIMYKKLIPSNSDSICLIRPYEKNLRDSNAIFRIKQAIYAGFKLNKFVIFDSNIELVIFNKMYANKMHISNYATCRTGIRSKIGQKKIIAKEKAGVHYQKGLISGGQIEPFRITYLSDWINVDEKILNAGGFDYNVIHNPKILIRQTGDTLICAIDKNKYYHLNNIHSLSMDKNHDLINLEILEAYINSDLFNFLYQLISNEKGRPMAQTRIEVIESLPIILPSKQNYNKLCKIVNEVTNGIITLEAGKKEINYLVFETYSISCEEVEYIQNKLQK